LTRIKLAPTLGELPLPSKRFVGALSYRYPLKANLWRAVGQQGAEANLSFAFVVLNLFQLDASFRELAPTRGLPLPLGLKRA
jgi:hypothetical protein